MKILHLRASNFYGGPERQLHLHAREALGSGHEITVASFLEGGHRPEFLGRIAEDGISTHALEVRSAYDPRTITTLRNYLRSEEFDLLCTHEYRSTIVGGLAVPGTGVRWIAFSRGFTSGDLKIQIYQFLDKLVMRRSDRIVAVSGAQKAKLERAGVPSEKISVVANAIDPGLMAESEAIDLRGRFDLPPDAFVVVAGGRFSREKGQVYLVDAAGIALRDLPHLRFVLFGDGPDQPALEHRIEELGLQGKVILPGFERNMPGAIKGSDLLVNPSLSEGMPNIVLEAMALSVPVLATAVGGVPEILEDHESGLLVPAADARALADGIMESATDPEAAARRSRKAHMHVTEHLGFARQFEQLCEVYGRVTDDRA